MSGCYQTLGPFYFGRAYEHPPHFTWSMTAQTTQTPGETGASWAIGNTKATWDAGNDSWGIIYGDTTEEFTAQARAQRVTIPTNVTVQFCRLRTVWRNGQPSDSLFVEVRKSTLNSTAVVTSATVPASNMSEEPTLGGGDPITPGLTTFTFPDTQLAAGEYFLVLRRTGPYSDPPRYSVRGWRASSQDYAGGESWVDNGVWEQDLISFVHPKELEFELGGTSEAATVQQGRYDLNVQFEGQYLRGYAGTYDLPPQSGPPSLELICPPGEGEPGEVLAVPEAPCHGATISSNPAIGVPVEPLNNSSDTFQDTTREWYNWWTASNVHTTPMGVSAANAPPGFTTHIRVGPNPGEDFVEALLQPKPTNTNDCAVVSADLNNSWILRVKEGDTIALSSQVWGFKVAAGTIPFAYAVLKVYEEGNVTALTHIVDYVNNDGNGVLIAQNGTWYQNNITRTMPAGAGWVQAQVQVQSLNLPSDDAYFDVGGFRLVRT